MRLARRHKGGERRTSPVFMLTFVEESAEVRSGVAADEFDVFWTADFEGEE